MLQQNMTPALDPISLFHDNESSSILDSIANSDPPEFASIPEHQTTNTSSPSSHPPSSTPTSSDASTALYVPPSLQLSHPNSSRPTRFHCTAPNCASTFKRTHDLARHQTAHAGIRRYVCTFSGCDRGGRNGFVRKDHWRQHLRQKHGA
jgi:hypothetical protein